VWKVVYETAQNYHVDAVRVLGGSAVVPGEQVVKLDIARDFPWLDSDSQQARDVERFRWFSNGYVALDPDNPNRVIDIRYSMLPNEIDALWSIELLPEAGASDHVIYRTQRDAGEGRASKLWQLLAGD
jgi:inner membrane protein